MTGASNSTRTRSNAQFALIALDRKIICSLDLMVVRPAGRWSPRLLATAKLNDIEPFGYLKDVLERMCSGHPMSRLDDLLPWNWTPSTAAAA